MGKVEHQGEIYEGEQAAIIEESLWNQVQQLMIKNSKTNGVFHRNKHGALLKGLVHCVNCNSLMFHTYTKKKEKVYRYYQCSAAQKQGRSSCQNRSVPAFELEKFVVDRIREIGGNQQILHATLEKVGNEFLSRKKPLIKEQEYLKKQQGQYQAKINNLIEAIGVGEHDSSSLRNNLSETESQLNNCNERLSEISRELIVISKPQIDKNDFKNALSLFDPVWDLLFLREQARVIQLLIENIAFDGQNGSLEISFSPLGIKALSTEIEAARKEYHGATTN